MIKFSLQDIATPDAQISDDDVWAVIKITTQQEREAKLRWMKYRDYLRTPFWRTIARWVKLRAGNQCSLCGSSERLEAHHRGGEYEHRGNEHLVPSRLTCLCKKCHTEYEESRIKKQRKADKKARKQAKKAGHWVPGGQGKPWTSWGQMTGRGVAKARNLRGIMR